MERHAYSYLGRPSSISSNSNLYQQHHPPMELAPSIWQQTHVSSELDGMLPVPHHRILLASDNHNVSSMRGAEGCSSRIPAPILGGSDSMNRGSPGSIQAAQSSPSEFYDKSNYSTAPGDEDWQQFVESNVARYSSVLLPSLAMASTNGLQQQSSSVGVRPTEGPMIRELIGNLGGSCSMGLSSNSGLLPSAGPSPSQQRVERGLDSLAAAFVKFNGSAAGNRCWNTPDNVDTTAGLEMPNNVGGPGRLTQVDPTRREPSFNHGTFHCLSPFTADPGFAERAARFSSFSNGNSAQHFPSDSESCGPARTRTEIQQEILGREIQSCFRGLGSVATATRDEESSLKQNHAKIEGKSTVSKNSSRAVSNLMGSARNGEEGGEEALQRTTSIDMSSDRMQAATSFTSSEQVNSAGPVEVCPSPGAGSGATDISIKKRKHNFEERPPSKHTVGSGSGSPHLDRDAKTAETEEAKAKMLRNRDGKDEMRGKALDRISSETSGESSPRPTKEHLKSSSEHPKTDYIHVRARRGQATDSHSLAERVRREKISERMKFLQDLVPGCSKVTGKAVMLDEIINYVQSLQRQVEFLSMKLASVNPRLDFLHESFLGKEGPHQGSQAMGLDAETSIVYSPLQPKHRIHQQQGLDYQLFAEAALRRNLGAMPIVPVAIPGGDSFEDAGHQTIWNDGDSELNSVVQMGLGNSQAMPFQGLQCHVPPGQVKVR